MTIARRDLLTGTALVLVGENLACGASTDSASTGSASGSVKCPHTHRLRTDFMRLFTKDFIGKTPDTIKPGCEDHWPDPKPNRLWPHAGQTQQSIVDDYVTFVNVLLTVAYLPNVNPTGPNPTLAADIVKWINANPINGKNWPNIPPPAEYANEGGIVTNVEIAVIQDRLMQAINSFCSGPMCGGGGAWPPH